MTSQDSTSQSSTSKTRSSKSRASRGRSSAGRSRQASAPQSRPTRSRGPRQQTPEASPAERSRQDQDSAPTHRLKTAAPEGSGFDAFDLHPRLLQGVADLGFATPTPIQQKAIPPGIEGQDLLACAMTGSGKTAAFLLPILERLMDAPRGKTRALVLAPTRELAAQIVEQFEGLARHTRLRAAAVYGGVGMGPQEKAFRQGVDIVVACPGRLLDHFRQPYAALKDLEVLVLDEADRMLDMGFLPDIRRVLKHLPTPDQTLLFSATMPREIAQLSKDLLRDPVSLDVERPSAPATGVTQTIFEVRQDLKSRLLLRLLEGDEIGNVLVFTRTKHRANRLAQFLVKHGVNSDRIHGNRTQGQRTKALAGFKNGDVRVLVATDIAARGIDVEALSHVVNFDVPHMPEDYIHRVGRTARARATGEAFTFVSPQEVGELRGIERALGKRLPRRQVEGFERDAPREEALEIPLSDRLAAHRARRRDERARSQAKTERGTGGRRGSERAASTREASETRGGRRGRDERSEGRRTQGARSDESRRGRGNAQDRPSSRRRSTSNRSTSNRADGNRANGNRADGTREVNGNRAVRRREVDGNRVDGNRARGTREVNGNRAVRRREVDGNRIDGNRAGGQREVNGNRASSGNRAAGGNRAKDGRGNQARNDRSSNETRRSETAGNKPRRRGDGNRRRREDAHDTPRPRPRNSLYY